MQSTESHIKAALCLYALFSEDAVICRKLIDVFGTPAAVVSLSPDIIRQELNLEIAFIERFPLLLDAAKNAAEREYNRIKSVGATVCVWNDATYPFFLRQISDPPFLLFILGQLPEEKEIKIAIIGSRKCSFYGEKATRQIVRDLCTKNIVTVSGLARGIDSIVHEETCAIGGKTIAIMGCGLGTCYPPENKSLFEKISKVGAVVTEYLFDIKPWPGNFPRRNRIIAGLVHGVLVTEGTLKSGSLITARIAAHEGRDVFALPGLTTSHYAEGPHWLIQQGAKLVTSANDIVVEYGFSKTNSREKIQEPPTDVRLRKVWEMLSDDPIEKEILSVRLNILPQELSSLLIQLELEGFIKMDLLGCVCRA